MIALDTNVLVYAHRAGSALHARAWELLERAANDARGWGLSDSVLTEFWSVVTHPRIADGPSSGEDALAFVDRLIEDGAPALWTPSPELPRRLLALAAERGVAGRRVHDLRIALTCHASGATEIWSHDHAFQSVAELPVVDPFGEPPRT
jgi:toxin-antitoxin system PIN domain toxin